MIINKFFLKVKRRLNSLVVTWLFHKPRIYKYKFLSNLKKINGTPISHQPVLFIGNGTVMIGNNVNLGVSSSPGFYNSYIYIEARTDNSYIEIQDDVSINNNACIISDGAGIVIGSKCLIGHNICIFDSDFHNLDPVRRNEGSHKRAKVTIGSNVFIGSNVIILKGVTIGENSVIAAGSVVVSSIPDNVIAGGNPCKVIKRLYVNGE